MTIWIILSFFLVLILISTYYSLQTLKTETKLNSQFGQENLFSQSSNKIKSFSPVVWRPLTPSSQNVFFVETSCAFNSSLKPGYLHLTKRQACAIYSTALLNPKHHIIIVHTCPLREDYFQRWKEDWPELLSLENIGIVQTEISLILSETPLKSLLDGRLNHSSYPMEHSSDLVRLAVLYKYGGTYLDTDIVSIRSLDDLKSDYIGAQEANVLANGILNFSPSGIGHRFLENTLKVLQDSYEGSAWSANGPELVTSEVRKFCKVDPLQPLDEMGKLGCGLTIYPQSVFYPIPYWEWYLYFENNTWPIVKHRLNNTYIVHFWNKLSRNTSVKHGSQQPYGLIAANYCSPIYSKAGNIF